MFFIFYRYRIILLCLVGMLKGFLSICKASKYHFIWECGRRMTRTHSLMSFIALQLFGGKQSRQKIIPVQSEQSQLHKHSDGQLDRQENAKAGGNTENHHRTDILINITVANLLLTQWDSFTSCITLFAALMVNMPYLTITR